MPCYTVAAEYLHTRYLPCSRLLCVAHGFDCMTELQIRLRRWSRLKYFLDYTHYPS